MDLMKSRIARWLLLDLVDETYRPWRDFRAVLLWALVNATLTTAVAAMLGVPGETLPRFVAGGAATGTIAPMFLRPRTRNNLGSRLVERLAAAVLVVAVTVLIER